MSAASTSHVLELTFHRKHRALEFHRDPRAGFPVPVGPTFSLTLRLLSWPAAMILGSWDYILTSGSNGINPSRSK